MFGRDIHYLGCDLSAIVGESMLDEAGQYTFQLELLGLCGSSSFSELAVSFQSSDQI